MSVVVPNLDDGKFHDIVASWDSDSNLREIYIDGIRYASLTASGYNAQQINFCVGKTKFVPTVRGLQRLKDNI